MTVLLGIMQGRLSPPLGDRIQAFPKYTWQDEFPKAKKCGLQLIEWVFQADQWEKNPLASDEGISEIKELIKETGVHVYSVCADYFKDLPLLRVGAAEESNRTHMLQFVMAQCRKLGVKYLVLPFVETAEIRTPEELEDIAEKLRRLYRNAFYEQVCLPLETTLGPEEFRKFLQRIDHPCIGVNYDIGDSAFLGFDTEQEISTYGERILNVHVKDRVKGGTTVPLGAGHAQFDRTFRALARKRYEGPIIFQVARQGDEVENAVQNLEFIRPYMIKYFN